jgi:hypothetical protein
MLYCQNVVTMTMPYVGAWLSLVERLVRDQEAGGSNPLAPTIPSCHLRGIPKIKYMSAKAESKPFAAHRVAK